MTQSPVKQWQNVQHYYSIRRNVGRNTQQHTRRQAGTATLARSNNRRTGTCDPHPSNTHTLARTVRTRSLFEFGSYQRLTRYTNFPLACTNFLSLAVRTAAKEDFRMKIPEFYYDKVWSLNMCYLRDDVSKVSKREYYTEIFCGDIRCVVETILSSTLQM